MDGCVHIGAIWAQYVLKGHFISSYIQKYTVGINFRSQNLHRKQSKAIRLSSTSDNLESVQLSKAEKDFPPLKIEAGHLKPR